MEIEAVIFDMDGVLCELDDVARLGYLSRLSGRTPQEIHRAIWGSGFEDLSDSGQITADEYLKGFGDRIGYPLTELEWIGYRKAGTRPILQSIGVAESLSARCQLSLLTNNGLMLKRTMDAVFPHMHQIFGSKIYVSAEFKDTKPNKFIYLKACEAIGCHPAKTLMIDDRLENVIGAQEAGLQGYRYIDWSELIEELRSRSLVD